MADIVTVQMDKMDINKNIARDAQKNVDCKDIKTGGDLMCVLMNKQFELRFNIYLKVVGSDNERNLIIYTDESYNSKYGYINLRKCKACIHGTDKRKIVIARLPTDDNEACKELFKFEAASAEEATDWVKAFTPRLTTTDVLIHVSPPVSPPARLSNPISRSYVMSPSRKSAQSSPTRLNGSTSNLKISKLTSTFSPEKSPWS